MPLQAVRQSRSKGEGSLHRASFLRQVQVLAEQPSLGHLDLEKRTGQTADMAELSRSELFALEGQTSQKTPLKHPSSGSRQLDLDKLEQMSLKIEALEKLVRKLAGRELPPTFSIELAEVDCRRSSDNNKLAGVDCQQSSDSNNSSNNNNNNHTNNNNKNTTTTNNTNNNNNEPNNYNNNNNKQDSREPSFSSLDLDDDNPESQDDLERESLDGFNPGAGSGFGLDQHEANQSFNNLGHRNLGHRMMTIGSSLGSLIHQNHKEQEGMQVGTAWEPSLMHYKKPKRVSFDENNLAHLRQTKGQNNFQLRQLGSKTEKPQLPAQDNKMTTAQTCWTSFQQTNLQQQPAKPAWEKTIQHEECTTNSLGREEGTLGNLEQNASTTNLPAGRSPKLNNNTSNLGIGTKNTAAWGILVDTGAAMSLAPWDFAQHIELRPFESTLQLRTITGEAIQAFGRRTVQLTGPNMSFQVSFVIASVQHAVLGMDALHQNQLGLLRHNFQQYYLVNKAGAAIQLKTQGQLLYIEACPRESGFSTCRGSSFPQPNGSLLDDKEGTLEEEGTTSGGAFQHSFSLEKLDAQQAKNTANLGTTTASQSKGARRRRKKKKKKKPSAQQASQESSQRSLEQKGHVPAAASPRTLEKTRIIKEMELAAEAENNNSLGSIDQEQLSLKILLTISLRQKWLIATTRATGACSEEALGNHLRTLGLGENKVDNNIFTGDELVILLCKHELLIGGSEMQQELFFCELSALIPLDPPTRLDTSAQVSFGNLTLEYQSTSHSVSLHASDCFVTNLLQRHDLAQETCKTSLDTEELNDQSASQDVALEADQQELFKQTVGELLWLASSCRPDLSFEAHRLAQSLESPTTRHQMQLRKVLRHLAETRHFGLSLHPATTKTTREKPQSLELVAYSSTSWSEAEAATSTTCLQLWGASLIAFHKPACAQEQHHAELESMRLALGLACLIRSLLQQLDMDELEKEVHIHLRISSWNQELVLGRPIAEQLGISRRNKHIQLRRQVQLSKVHPSKNLAHNLSHNASDRAMHAKLRLNPEVAETGALSTVFGQEPAFPFSSSSLLVGMVAAKPSQMEKHQLRQLALEDSEACLESLSKNLATNSVASLTLCSLSFESRLGNVNLESWSFPTPSLTLRSLIRQRDRLHSLTKQSLSLNNCSLHSLTGQSLSLIDENCFQNLSFRKGSLEDGNQELVENLATKLLQRKAETNSFSNPSLQEREPHKEAKMNSFWTHSFRGILSLWWPIFLLCSFQMVCSALFSKTSFSNSAPTAEPA